LGVFDGFVLLVILVFFVVPNIGRITSFRRSPFDLEYIWNEQWNLKAFQGNGYDCEVLS